MTREACQFRDWFTAHYEGRGPTGGERKSNRPDNDSAELATARSLQRSRLLLP